MKCNIIINPRAGKGKAVKVWKEVEQVFHASGWTAAVHVTDYASDLIRDLDDCDGIVAVGGDGTFHNVVNILMRSTCKIPLGLIPAGTGNALMMDLDCLNPLEAKAGMDLIQLKKQYGNNLAFMGGIDVQAMAAADPKVIEEEISAKIPIAMEGGGYIYHSDHSVPNDVSFNQYKRVMDLVLKYGAY